MVNSVTRTQPTRIKDQQRSNLRLRCCCGCALLPLLILACLLSLAFFAPGRTNLLILGIDARPDETNLSRTDTMILASFVPLKPYAGLLSIPRDLWVTLPDGSGNRINTAHFFAEAEQPGSGPAAAMQTVRQNFGVNVDYYVRLRFDGVKEIVDAMGGMDIELPEAVGKLPAGKQHLGGEQTLALVRERYSGDDFTRMEHGQLFLKALLRQAVQPGSWLRWPAIGSAIFSSMQSDVPPLKWLQIGLLLLRLGPDGLDGRTITRDMITPFTTDAGAQVLLPNWEMINPVLMDLFEQ
jgi:polyisoprenyl-teichoic acid--peptidoglycan teichoic acid transferase